MKQPKMNAIWDVAVFVGLVWLLPSAEAIAAQGKVNIVHLGALGSWSVPLHIAQEQGLFTKHGVEVQLVRAPAHFAQRDRSFRESVTDLGMLHE